MKSDGHCSHIDAITSVKHAQAPGMRRVCEGRRNVGPLANRSRVREDTGKCRWLFAGRSIANRLAEVALQSARAEGLPIVVRGLFIRAYLQTHLIADRSNRGMT
jgi:hypothetical protein